MNYCVIYLQWIPCVLDIFCAAMQLQHTAIVCWSKGQSGKKERKAQNNWHKYKSAIDANKLIGQQISFVYIFIPSPQPPLIFQDLRERQAVWWSVQFGNSYWSNLPQALQEYSKCKTGWDVKAWKQYKIKQKLLFIFSMLAKVQINTRLICLFFF